MQLIANGLNKQFLSSCLPPKGTEVDGVLAAIAYGSDQGNTPLLISNCVENKYRLDIWMRYDQTVPVTPSLLKTLLRHERDNLFCKLIPDMLHAKVIWWQGWGAYIGSANLTNRAWYSNIEAGVFLTDVEIQESGFEQQLEAFFSELESLDVTIPLSKTIIDEQVELARLKAKHQAELNGKPRLVPEWQGISYKDDTKAADKHKQRFSQEWHSTLNYIHGIAEVIEDYRPSWVSEDIPALWQVDQFLHAYYYNQVRQPDGTHPFDDFNKRNSTNPNAALKEQLVWWQHQKTPPSNEDFTFYESAPTIRRLLSKENISQLSVNDFSSVCSATHATKDHVIKIPTSTLGRGDVTTLTREERIPLYAKLMFSLRNAKGQTITELLEFVLYGGKPESVWERIYMAGKLPEYKMLHYGINSIAEVAGWAMPEHTPPRNGRTNKALRALGYPVKVYI
ncbi:phospholipase D family protein [Shewanella colwelliana]|uniref:phospholipase D family protein n=1 Tax=Shewanella colwelliana TaxID=23 RepID=UPI001C7CA1A7|nr:phospholipase D family protein [Shewanella colwelliana]